MPGNVRGSGVSSGILLKQFRVKSHGAGLREGEPEQLEWAWPLELVHLGLESQHWPYAWWLWASYKTAVKLCLLISRMGGSSRATS